MKKQLKEKAVALRKKGYSYNLIRDSIPVSKSTLSVWLRDIPYSPNPSVQKRITSTAQNIARKSSKRKEQSLKQAARVAHRDIGTLSQRDLFMIGIGLYIGEGSKTKDIVRIVNSDPQVITLALWWFKEVFGLSNEHFSITIHLYPDTPIEDTLRFWSKVTGIPRSQFGKTQIDTRKKKKKPKKKVRYGTAHVLVRSNGKKEFGVFLSRRILAQIEEVYLQNKKRA